MQNHIVGIVVVAYRNPAMTEKFVLYELSKIKIHYRLIVINVASNEKDSLLLAERCKLSFVGRGEDTSCGQKILIWTPDNLGYARGNNLGVSYLLKFGPKCDFYLFTNDDIEIRSYNIIESLITISLSDSQIAGIGPRVVCLDGHEGSPQRKYYSPWQIMREHFTTRMHLNLYQTKKERNRKPVPPEGPVYWVSGAFMLVKAYWFEKVGGFDEDTFLYYEEPILAERFKAYNAYFYYYPNVSVIHYEGGSSKAGPHKKIVIDQSRLIYYDKYMHENYLTMTVFRLYCILKRIILSLK